ncbi:phenylalanine--tRNA ligase subunit beta [Candidatus Saccharibacteria bacterium]|nr:phenylalanine--tRNA ligase subunit beta [Candidatus Saccharibacteria bacterium]
MKVSIQTINYINQHYGCSKQINNVDDIIKKIGSQLGEVEGVEDWGHYYEGIVVARVVSCQKHPNADKLHVCLIDDGGATKDVARDKDGYVEVVCGAPNVKEGMTVAWLPPGVTVPSTISKDPFVLGSREIRGVVSNGMLASPAELNISNNHDGILEIDEDEVGKELKKPGTAFKKLYGLDDVVIDIENKMFTHRPDCFGILGVARELAGIQNLKFVSPKWYTKGENVSTGNSLPIEVKVEDKSLVPRFIAVSMSDIQVMPSPIWLQSFLTRVGIKPINNIVDLTNYYMQLTGQPLHAYDYDKVAKLSGSKPTLIARQATKGDKVALLNGKTIEFETPTILISTDKQAIGVGGIMGGSETEVDEGTKNIILECGNFDMYNIRRTSMKYGLFTDAVTRFTKGQSIYQNDRVLKKIVADISVDYGGKVASEIFDIRPELPSQSKVKLNSDFVNKRLGSNLSSQDMKELLENVEFAVMNKGDDLIIDPPFWRTDIEIPEDVVEEIGRLYGYDRIKPVLPKRDTSPSMLDDMLEVKTAIRDIVSASGANEVLTYSFVHGDLLAKVGQDSEMAFKLSNAISPDLQYYRLSLLPSLLDKIHGNTKAGHSEFAIFEINKSFCKDLLDDEGLPVEEERVAFVFTADDKVALEKYAGAPYYQAQRYLVHLLDGLGISAVFEPATKYTPKLNVSKAAFAPFEPKRAAIIKDSEGEFIGELGEFSAGVKRNLKLPEFTAGFELDISQLLKLSNSNNYVPLSRFPSSEQDISLQVDKNVSYEIVFNVVMEQLLIASEEHGYRFKLTPVDIYCPEKTSNKNVTLRVKLTHNDRTLVTEEVNSLMNQIAEFSNKKIDANRL